MRRASEFARYALGLGSYLRRQLGEADCWRRIEDRLANREANFLRVVERGVYQNPRSPYRRILEHVDIQFGDVVGLVRAEGVDRTLGRLCDAGVYVTVDEFRGRRRIRRSGLEFRARVEDFDNPLVGKHYQARTSGSRSAGHRVDIGLDLLAHEAAHHALFLRAFDLAERPHVVWLPSPPGVAGMKCLLWHAKLGKATDRWFVHNEPRWKLSTFQDRLTTAGLLLESRVFGRPIPVPEHAPLEDPSAVVRWLAANAARGEPVLVQTNASSAVRASLSASDMGVDIAGTFFRVGSEPLTDAKVAAISASGSRFAGHYAMAEAGLIGIACADAVAADEVHLVADKLAVIQREMQVGAVGAPVGALALTTVLPSSPKLLLNFESGDYGVLKDRACRCAVGTLGLNSHLHTIRSYEKLTSEGMHFLGSELTMLLDEVLPARFGGHPTDYQLVEGEDHALPTVELRASPRIGYLDEAEVIETALAVLSRAGGRPQRMMAERWRQAGTLRLVRREPLAAGSAKVLSLHVHRR